MSLPKSLNMALSRFDKSSRQLCRLVPTNQTSFGPTDTTIFRLPTSGVLDLHSLSLIAQLTFTGTTGAAVVATGLQFTPGQLIRRLDILIGGVQVWGASCSDFSTAYLARRLLAEPGYVKNSSGKAFEWVTAGSPAAGASVSVPAMMADLPGLGSKNMRYLPLAAVGEVEIRVTWDVNNRMYLPTATTCTAIVPQLNYTMKTFEGNLYDQMIASRLQQGPLEVAFENWTYFQGVNFTTGTSMPISIATQSLDYLVVTQKEASITNTNYHDMKRAGASSTYQITVNGTPVSNVPLADTEVYWATLEALDGLGNNPLVDPAWASATEFLTKSFLYVHRFAFETAGDEGRHLISGLNSYGQTVPLVYQVAGASGSSYTPVAIAFHTSTLEIQPGRLINVVN